MPDAKRTRERQLAKQAQQRKLQREARRRRHNATVGLIGSLLVAGLLVVAYFVLTGGDQGTDASKTPTPKPSHSPKPKGLPTPTASVSLAATLPDAVACGGSVPAAAADPKPQFDRAPDPKDVLRDGTDYTAVVQTSCGTFEMKLYPEVAPKTVASFVFLAQQRYFDGTWFHRIVSDFVIQGGSPDGNGGGPNSGPGYEFGLEVDPKVNFDRTGLLAMGRASDPNTNGSQWFVTTGDASSLSQQYTIFGEVTKGMDVVTKIGVVPTTGVNNDEPTQAVYVDKVTINPTKASANPSPTGTPSP